jgi:hypothetical protein
MHERQPYDPADSLVPTGREEEWDPKFIPLQPMGRAVLV